MTKRILLLLTLFFVVSAISVLGGWPQSCDSSHIGQKSCSGYREVVKCVGADSHYSYPHFHDAGTCSSDQRCIVGSGCVHQNPPDDDPVDTTPNYCSLASTEYCVGNNPSGDFECKGEYWCERLDGNKGKIISGSTSCTCPSGYTWGPRGEYGYSWCFNTATTCDASRAANNKLPDGTNTGWRCGNTPDPRCMSQPECGDGNKDSGEECEYPNTNNNQYCPQSMEICDGKKTGLRDSYGKCDSSCGCNLDEFKFLCVKDSCGATCTEDSDCDDQNPYTVDTCTDGCSCEHEKEPFCGDGFLDVGEECDDGNNFDGDGCSATCTTEHEIPEFNTLTLAIAIVFGGLGLVILRKR